jgi:hypothetical protein
MFLNWLICQSRPTANLTCILLGNLQQTLICLEYERLIEIICFICIKRKTVPNIGIFCRDVNIYKSKICQVIQPDELSDPMKRKFGRWQWIWPHWMQICYHLAIECGTHIPGSLSGVGCSAISFQTYPVFFCTWPSKQLYMCARRQRCARDLEYSDLVLTRKFQYWVGKRRLEE